MTFSQYGDYFYLYILLLTLIPAVVLGLLGKNIKYYGIIASIFMIFIIVGRDVSLLYFTMFMIFEICLIKGYFYIRQKTKNKYVYWIFLFSSM
ncbi:D-alanyl-lipoteichoic acid biosynthesis protein DltB, partial [Clostridium sp. CCUG 7971]|nr:D-alanyl-lipoteichoic acid biosynthesis protein DltB [Clostridium sp. CCUG 7971]